MSFWKGLKWLKLPGMRLTKARSKLFKMGKGTRKLMKNT